MWLGQLATAGLFLAWLCGAELGTSGDRIYRLFAHGSSDRQMTDGHGWLSHGFGGSWFEPWLAQGGGHYIPAGPGTM